MGQICSKADDGSQLIMDECKNELPHKNKKKKKDGVIHNNTKYGN